MLKFKKLIIALCGFVTLMSATALSAYAYDVNLISGDSYSVNADTGRIITSVTLNISDLATSNSSTEGFTKDGTVMFKVPKGVFDTASKVDLGSAGLHYYDDMGDPVSPVWTIGLDTTTNDEYDVFIFIWSCIDQVGMWTANGDLVGAKLRYTENEAIDVPMTLLTELDKGAAEPQRSALSICEYDGTVVSMDAPFAENTATYTLAAGTSTVTKTEAGGGDDDETTATVVGYYTGDKEAENDNLDTTDASVAILGTPAAPENVANTLVWTVTPTEGDAQTFEQVVNVSGGATVKFGLVLRNITAGLISTVSAVLQ